jgi:hypothetical protein
VFGAGVSPNDRGADRISNPFFRNSTMTDLTDSECDQCVGLKKSDTKLWLRKFLCLGVSARSDNPRVTNCWLGVEFIDGYVLLHCVSPCAKHGVHDGRGSWLLGFSNYHCAIEVPTVLLANASKRQNGIRTSFRQSCSCTKHFDALICISHGVTP